MVTDGTVIILACAKAVDIRCSALLSPRVRVPAPGFFIRRWLVRLNVLTQRVPDLSQAHQLTRVNSVEHLADKPPRNFRFLCRHVGVQF